ncbi:hypothetical protein D1AOALGA4SA_2009 [Olavius algarvensis Delta 1 endosymbiont]|nr:hypothetical protein D1AOALGA4SA_2009 [Olavius algarvensis Delta 1 endosymbiont]
MSTQATTSPIFPLRPWLTGLIYDTLGTYLPALQGMLAIQMLSVIGIWIVAPRKVNFIGGAAS